MAYVLWYEVNLDRYGISTRFMICGEYIGYVELEPLVHVLWQVQFMMVLFNLQLVLDELQVSILGLVAVVLIVVLACCVRVVSKLYLVIH